MKKGEQATVTVSSDFLNGYLDVGFVSAKSTIIYEVELIDFSKVWLTFYFFVNLIGKD